MSQNVKIQPFFRTDFIENREIRNGTRKEIFASFLQHPVTEERVYQQMALTASSMAYSWSKWNSEIKNREQIIVQGTEHLEDEPLLEVSTEQIIVQGAEHLEDERLTEVSTETRLHYRVQNT